MEDLEIVGAENVYRFDTAFTSEKEMAGGLALLKLASTIAATEFSWERNYQKSRGMVAKRVAKS